jgi:secreted trypsin-like serine protease
LLCAIAAICLLCAPLAHAQSPEPRIVGGSTASISNYPWQAAVVISPAKAGGNAFNRQFCGGSLLTSRIVITAGHCVWDTDPDPGCVLVFCTEQQLHLDPDDVDVVLGRTTLSDTSQGAEIAVIGVYTNPSFQMHTGTDGVPSNDISYLVLGSASAQTQIKIAGTDEGELWDAGSPAQITGWGSTTNPSGNHVNDLRAASVSIFPDTTCGAAYPGDFNSNSMLCAGVAGGGVDTCSGDSGGPLEAPIDGGGFRLVGVTSFGQGCGQSGFPGVYARVAGPLRSQIQSDVNNLDGAFGLPGEPIFGSGAKAVDAPTGSPAGATAKARPFAKCKRIKDKRKRRRCIKKVRKTLKSKR